MNNNQNNINKTLDLLNEYFSLSIAEGMRGKLEQYIELLLEWNSFAGLISKTDEDHIVSRHLVDSLSLVNIVKAAAGPGDSPGPAWEAGYRRHRAAAPRPRTATLTAAI